MIWLNQLQLERLSEILGNLSLLFFASLVLPVFYAETPIRIPAILMGSGLTLISFYISINLLKGGER